MNNNSRGLKLLKMLGIQGPKPKPKPAVAPALKSDDVAVGFDDSRSLGLPKEDPDSKVFRWLTRNVEEGNIDHEENNNQIPIKFVQASPKENVVSSTAIEAKEYLPHSPEGGCERMQLDHATPEVQGIVSSQILGKSDLAVPLSASEKIVTTTNPPRIGVCVNASLKETVSRTANEAKEILSNSPEGGEIEFIQLDHVTPEGQGIVSRQILDKSDLAIPLSVSEEIVTTTNPPRIGLKARKVLFPDEVEVEHEENMIVMPLDEPPDIASNVMVLETQAAVSIEVQSVCGEESPDKTLNAGDGAAPKRRRRSQPTSSEPVTRKRKLYPTKWKATQAKVAYNSGLPHVSLRGKDVRGREMKNGCAETCKRKCHFLITEERRKALFDKYWGLKDKSLQWYFLAKLVHPVDVKRRKALSVEDEEPYRKYSYEYGLSDSNCKRVVVCQTMFLATFDISVRVVKTAITKNSPDKRGKHTTNRKRMSQDLVSGVKDHIKSFPVVPSHYCRMDSSRRYLDEHLSVSMMYRLYMVPRDKSDPGTASLRQYRDIFNSFFNLGFFKPKKDQCSLCVQWDSLSDVLKSSPENEELSQRYKQHFEDKQFVRALKKSDKEKSRAEDSDQTVRVLTADLQKVLYTPTSEEGEFFYKRKLSCYNYTVYDCTKRQARLYVWDQTTGRRGANEMSSFMQDAITQLVEEEHVTIIIVYSDSCTGQNRNQYHMTMYYFLAMKYGIIIIHRYLEKGHTQMECDSVHARIEKKGKHKIVHVPSQWYGIMKSAKVKQPKYKVYEKKQDEIFSYRELAHSQFQWAKVPLSKVREIKISGKSPGIVTFKTSWTEEEKVAQILVPRVGRPINWKSYQPKVAYTGRIPLPPKLITDLKWFINKGHIPQPHVGFYEALFEIPQLAPKQIENSEVDILPELLSDEEDEDDEPQEVAPHQDVVADLNAREYDIDFDEADPFLLDDNARNEEAENINNGDESEDSDDVE